MNITKKRKQLIIEELKHIEIITRDIIKDFLNFDIETKEIYLILESLIILQKSFTNKTIINLNNVIQFKNIKGGLKNEY